MNNNIFTELKSNYEFLTKSEKKIADFLLENPQQFITLSTAKLSEVAGVSQGSINNFSKKFSNGSFSSLKLNIAACLPSQTEQPFTVIDKSSSVKEALEIKIKENNAAFCNTLEINSEETLQQVVDKILNAKKIEIYGIFHSGIAAKDFCFQLIQLGLPATFIEDTLLCAVSTSMLNKDSLVIAFSSTGCTKEIIDTVELAKNNNVPIVSITCNKNSPLAKISDHVLLTTSSGMTISDRGNEVRLSQLFIVDALCSYIRSVIDNSGNNLYFKLQEIIKLHSVSD